MSTIRKTLIGIVASAIAVGSIIAAASAQADMGNASGPGPGGSINVYMNGATHTPLPTYTPPVITTTPPVTTTPPPPVTMTVIVQPEVAHTTKLAVRAWRSGKHVWSILARATRDNDYWVTKQVNLQSDTGGHWHIIKSALTSGVGKTTFTVTLPKHAGRHYRVTVSGGGASLKTSRVMSLRY